MSEPASPSADAPTLTCPRHKVATPLSCSSCGTPICPRCYVRTAVGLRCPTCAEGVTVRIGGRAKWPFVVVAVAVVAAVAIVVARSSSSGDSRASDGSETSTSSGEGPARGYRLVSKPELGYSVQVPVDWQAAADNSPSTVSYSLSRASEGSLRVTSQQTEATASQVVDGLIAQISREGGQEFVQTPVTVGDAPAIRLTYRSPVSAAPGAALSTHSSTIVKRGPTVFSVQLATTDPGSYETVFAFIQSSFRLL